MKDAYWFRESSQKNSDVYIKQQLRNSEILYDVMDALTHEWTDIVHYRFATLFAKNCKTTKTPPKLRNLVAGPFLFCKLNSICPKKHTHTHANIHSHTYPYTHTHTNVHIHTHKHTLYLHIINIMFLQKRLKLYKLYFY